MANESELMQVRFEKEEKIKGGNKLWKFIWKMDK